MISAVLLLLSSVSASIATTGPGQFRGEPAVKLTVFEDKDYMVMRLMALSPWNDPGHSEVFLRRSLNSDETGVFLRASPTANILYRGPDATVRLLFEGHTYSCQGIGCVTNVRIFEMAPSLTVIQRSEALARLLVVPFGDTLDSNMVEGDNIAVVKCEIGRDDIFVEEGAVSSNYVAGISAAIVPEALEDASLQPPQATNNATSLEGLDEDTCVMLLEPSKRANKTMGPWGIVYYDQHRREYALCDWKSRRKHWAMPRKIQLCNPQQLAEFVKQRKKSSLGETISSFKKDTFVLLRTPPARTEELKEPLKILNCGSDMFWSYRVYNPTTSYSHLAWFEDLEPYRGEPPVIQCEKRPFELGDIVRINEQARDSANNNSYEKWMQGNPYRIQGYESRNRYQLLSYVTSTRVKISGRFLQLSTEPALSELPRHAETDKRDGGADNQAPRHGEAQYHSVSLPTPLQKQPRAFTGNDPTHAINLENVEVAPPGASPSGVGQKRRAVPLESTKSRKAKLPRPNSHPVEDPRGVSTSVLATEDQEPTQQSERPNIPAIPIKDAEDCPGRLGDED